MEPRVFVVESPRRYDVTSAGRYGPLVYLLETGSCNALNPPATLTLIKARLAQEGYRPGVDRVCMTGSQLLTALFLASIVSMYPGIAVSMILFDARSGQYVNRVTTFPTVGDSTDGEEAEEAEPRSSGSGSEDPVTDGRTSRVCA